MNLLEITQNAQALQALINEAAIACEGDITEYGPIIEKWQSECDLSLAQKLEAIGSIIDDSDATLAALDLQLNKIKARIKHHETRKEALKNWVLVCFKSSGIKKERAGQYLFYTQNNPRALVLDVAIEALPDAYVKKTLEPRVMELKRSLEVGDIDAAKLCHLDEPKLSIRIK